MELSEISSMHSPKPEKLFAISHSPHLTETHSYITSAASEEHTLAKSSDAHSSYRDKLKDRFSFVKKQTVKSVTASSNFHEISNKILTLKSSMKSLAKENDIIQSEVANRHKGSSDFEEYVFFCEDNNYSQKEEEVEEVNKTE